MKPTRVITGIAATLALALCVPPSVSSPVARQLKSEGPVKAAGEAPLPLLKGNVLYSNTWTQGGEGHGIYYLPTNPGETFEMIHQGDYGTFGNFEQNGYYFTTEKSFYNEALYNIVHSVWDAETGKLVNIISMEKQWDCGTVAIDCATDPTTGKVYAASFYGGTDKYQLSEMNFTKDEATAKKIGKSFDVNIAALACTSKGQLYAICRNYDANNNLTGSTLLKVNKEDATYERIGTVTGCIPRYNSSATIDPATDRMFWTVCPPDESGALYEVDLNTGVATLVYEFPGQEQVVGLRVEGQAAPDKAPAAPLNLDVKFDGGQLTGTLTCDMPATTFDGQTASGQVSYTILIDKKEYAKGTVDYGGKISHPIQVAESGNHVFTVYTSNSAGNSPKNSIQIFAGYGKPTAPRNVTANWAAGKVTLTWSPVTDCVDGGYIDESAVTYNVRGYDGNLLAENVKGTSWTGDLTEPDSPRAYFFTVTAVSEGNYSDAARSNTLSLGALTPPFSTVFSQGALTLNGYTIIDANNDSRTWMWDDNGKGVRAPYNTDHITPMDDWLITPALRLKAGNAYDLTFDASVMQADCPETFEVLYGTDNNVEAMKTVLIPSTTIDNTSAKQYSGRIIPPADGNYFIGIHCISDPDKYYLFINNLSVSAPQVSLAPAQPADFKVKPDASGAYKAVIEMKAPTTNIQGETLTSLSKVVLERDGVAIKTFNSPAPGATLSFTDNVEKGGTYTYTAAAYNAEGRGQAVTAQVVIGIDKPAAPANLKVKETSNIGEVSATWDAVTTDVNGMAIPAGKVTYDVYRLNGGNGEWELKEEGLSSNSCTLRCLEDTEEQEFVFLGVVARTEGGSSDRCESEPVAVGKAYDTVQESAANCYLSYIWALDGTVESMLLFRDGTIRSCSSQDGDDGYIAFRAGAMGQYGWLQSGKVAVAEKSPYLTFYTYNFVGSQGDKDVNTIDVAVRESGTDGGFTSVLNKTVTELSGYDTEAGWVKCTVPLSDFAGKDVELRITGTVYSFSYVMLDNIFIGALLDQDLSIESVEAPSRVAPGTAYDINVTVMNKGAKDADGWSLKLYEGETVVNTRNFRTLGARESYKATFNMQMSPVATEPAEYRVVIEYSNDEDNSNNESELFKVAPIVASHPRATGLTAEKSENGVNLIWQAPALSTTPETVTEDFETADSFAHDFADWQFVDEDLVAVGGFNEFKIPGIVNTETLSSFFVFNPTELNLPKSQFGANSGDKYLASLLCWDNGQVDDWAISPDLSGKAQTVSFYARSFQSAYPEKVEVLYSTESDDPSDFKVVNQAVEVPGAWIRYEAQLPEGAKYFAIRSCASGNFMLMVDDVTYEAKATADKYTVQGYNVYRNGKKITDSPVNGTSYTDTAYEEGLNSYVVTTVYGQGESAPSNVASVDGSGLEEIVMDSENAVYYNLQGFRVEKPAKGGIYIRHCNGKSQKVIIR